MYSFPVIPVFPWTWVQVKVEGMFHNFVNRMLGVPMSHLSTLSLHLTLCPQQAAISPETKALSWFYPSAELCAIPFLFLPSHFFLKDRPHCFPPNPQLNPVLLSSFHPSHHTENNNLLMATSNRLPLGLRLTVSTGWATGLIHLLDFFLNLTHKKFLFCLILDMGDSGYLKALFLQLNTDKFQNLSETDAFLGKYINL